MSVTYPTYYSQGWTLADGQKVNVRPIRPEDEPLMVHFHTMLSPLSVRRRYHDSYALAARIDHERLRRICRPNLENEIAIIVDHLDMAKNEHNIIAVGRLEDLPGTDETEFAIVVVDAWQRRGLGRRLLEELVSLAQGKGLGAITTQILPTNTTVKRLCKKVGFSVRDDFEENTTFARLDL